MIRFAQLEDTEAIMDFIHREWKADHILSRDKQFFLYEHANGANINFAIAINDDGNINGILGFIPSSFKDTVDICTVIWKVAKRAGNPMLGMELLDFLLKCNKFRTVMSVGINERTIGIYTYLGMYNGTLTQYVMMNSEIKDFNIAKLNQELFQPNFINVDDYQLKLLNKNFEFDFIKYQSNVLYKDAEYFKKRYFEHPIYKYRIYGILHNDEISSLLVTRVQKLENSQTLRIVDFIGQESEIKFISKQLYNILIEEKLEYVDFYCFGLNEDELKQAGFVRVDPNSEELIIPNYFQPFMQKNIKINFFSNTENIDNLRLFKADGDQDRPN